MENRLYQFATIVAKNAKEQLSLDVDPNSLALYMALHQEPNPKLENGAENIKMTALRADVNEIFIAIVKMQEIENRVKKLENKVFEDDSDLDSDAE